MMYRQLVGSLIYLTLTRLDICSWCDESLHVKSKETSFGSSATNIEVCEKYN